MALYRAVHAGEHGLDLVPGLIMKALETEVWKERIVEVTGQRIDGFSNFVEYVRATPPEGLGASIELLEKLTSGDPVAVDLLDRALQRPHGGDRKSEAAKAKINVDNVNVERPTGNSAEQAIRRLRRHRPDIHARVMAGELSAHAGMIEAGFRKPPPATALQKIFALLPQLNAAERDELTSVLDHLYDMP